MTEVSALCLYRPTNAAHSAKRASSLQIPKRRLHKATQSSNARAPVHERLTVPTLGQTKAGERWRAPLSLPGLGGHVA